MNSNYTKPPLGVMPRNIWMVQRQRELVRAIYEHIEYRPFREMTTEWIRELAELSELIIDEDKTQ